jgi:hypothetical protein
MKTLRFALLRPVAATILTVGDGTGGVAYIQFFAAALGPAGGGLGLTFIQSK